VPAKRGSFLLGDFARQFIGGAQGCTDDQHLLGGSSSLKPGLSTSGPQTGCGRYCGNSAHGISKPALRRVLIESIDANSRDGSEDEPLNPAVTLVVDVREAISASML
jgi:hypothetical protein